MKISAVKAYIPRTPRRQAFAQFALRDMTFSGWLRTQLSRWRQELGVAAEADEVQAQDQRSSPQTRKGRRP